MFLELIATVFAGLATFGLISVIARFGGGRLPRWLAPVGAGVAMIAVTITSEYGWFSRTSASLPEGVVIAQSIEKRAFYQPWTYVTPYVDRFVAVDVGTLQSHPAQPGQHIAQLYFFGRWAPVNSFPMLVDCPGGRRASLADGAAFDDQGVAGDAQWFNAGPSDPLIKTVCEAA